MTVVDGTALQITLSGTAGPTGATGVAGPTGATGATGAAGPNTVSTSTTTNLTGYIFGNGTTVGGATAATSSATANTLVLRNANGGGVSFAESAAGSTTVSISNSGDPVPTGSTALSVTNFASDGLGINVFCSLGTAANIYSSGGIGAVISSDAGNHVVFGNDPISDGGRNRSFVARVKGAIGWFRGAFTGRIQAADTLTADRTYTLPNDTGTVALTNPSSGIQTFSGSQSFTGQVQLTGQAATDANSAMTRGLALAEEAFNLHNYGFGVNSNGGTQGAGSSQSRSGSTATGYGRTVITSNAMRSGASGGITMLANVPIAATIFGSADVAASLNGGVIRLIVGDPGGSAAVAPRFGGQDALVARGFGAEIFYSTANTRQEIRLFAHNGTSYVTSAGVAFPNAFTGMHTVLVSSDGLGTIKLFAFTSSGSFAAPQRPTLYATLTGGPSGNFNLGGSFITVVCVNEGTVAPTTRDAIFDTVRSKFIVGASI